MFQAHSIINPTTIIRLKLKIRIFAAQEQGWKEMWCFPQMTVMSSEKDSSHPFKGVGLISDIAGGCVVEGGLYKGEESQDNAARRVSYFR